MNSIIVFLVLSAFFTASAQQIQSNVIRGSSLTPGINSTWLSRFGLFAFGFYKQGNGYAVGIFLAGIPQKTVVWTANRDEPPVSSNATLHFAGDGKLVLRTTPEQRISTIANSVGSTSAAMLDSGNLSFEHPTDSLLPGQRLLAGTELFSSKSESDHSTGIFRLKMQHDGNLVQYPVDTPDTGLYAYYSSVTFGSGDNVTLNFSPDGHLYMLNATLANIRNLTDGGYPTKETIYLMRIDTDGIFRLYSYKLKPNGNWSIVWSSSNDLCDPKGLCSLNGYCVSIDTEPKCVCLPGFEMVHPGNWTPGCDRSFSAPGCNNKNEYNAYTMEELANTKWEDVSYSIMLFLLKEDCKQACLEDCNCEAALFEDGKCKKQRLPLRYGRRKLSESTIAFIKVGKSRPVPSKDMRKENREGLRLDILIISAVFLTFGGMMLVISGIVFYKNHLWYRKLPFNGDVELSGDVALQPFTYLDLEKATNGFREEVGRGSFGTVYKGAILNGQKIVAVKKLEKVLAEGERETHHRNLVRLLGYCQDGIHRLLVYEFMSNGSLADILFTPEKQPCWEERMGIARDIARGILYLHEECEQQIIHCDIKPQNILMDDYGCAKICDFGLAKLLKPEQTRTFTGIRGTRGYVAPEWHRKLPITVKADVYSYGIVLLEIICRRKCVDWSLPEDISVLEDWAYHCFEAGDLGQLLERMVKLGLWCIQDEPSLRPSMKKVLLMLEGTVDIPIPPSPTSFFSVI
ncbi:hypothetical protein I3843_03G121100 [Carya illinoinensis]|uniref:Receptor-like serine/threonine-protein kinase n=1 Tax=Carya illinoinensis TaxID=32201 RepID=A0A922FFM2_CARIL|nr:hypothetical protein I3842_03G121200 [Carya illinoinensis]KAG7987192.1 hypothetical protein I3843_03G121100 [Carya illinoinensis]